LVIRQSRQPNKRKGIFKAATTALGLAHYITPTLGHRYTHRCRYRYKRRYMPFLRERSRISASQSFSWLFSLAPRVYL